MMGKVAMGRDFLLDYVLYPVSFHPTMHAQWRFKSSSSKKYSLIVPGVNKIANVCTM